jgi:DNA-binding HxlR family transcriptional regulator
MECSEDCRVVASVLALVGDKWSVLIIMKLNTGILRFNELKRMVGGISQRMLTLTLRGLEREGLVQRMVHPSVPPRVEYQLTELGKSLLTVVSPLGEWARGHVHDLHAARESFDEGAVHQSPTTTHRITRGYQPRASA